MVKKLLYRLFQKNWKTDYIKGLQKKGLRVGQNLSIQHGCIIDESHCWHISIGDNVTLAPHVLILAHDGSSFLLTGYTKVKNVVIGNNVFIGAHAIIMPGVTITDNVVIGAGSVVTKSLLVAGIYAGTPATLIYGFDEYREKLQKEMAAANLFTEAYTLRNKNFTSEMKAEMVRSCQLNNQLFVK